MKKEHLRLAQEDLTCERSWEWDGITVLSVRIVLPQCRGRRAQRFNRYYRQFCRAYLKYCESELFPRAAEDCQKAMACSAPWSMAHASLCYTVTYQDDTILSLYTDAKEVDLPPRLTMRRADTWDLRRALPIPIGAFFPEHCAVRRKLWLFARAQACAQIEEGSAVYYPTYRKMLRRHLNTRSFYLTEEGLCFFYPMYTVAPSAEGIVRFVLPYGEDGPLIDGICNSDTKPQSEGAPQQQ